MKFPKIAHIITDLNGFGGTEATLLRYLKQSAIPNDRHKVFVLKSIGVGNTLGTQMVAAGITVFALDQRHGSISLKAMIRLYRELKEFKPDVISGWLYHPSLLASVFSILLTNHPVAVWHIRCLTFASILKTPGRFIVQRLLAVLSRLINPVLVSNSSVAMREHASIGFEVARKHWTIIPNGIDVAQYFPQSEEGLAVRRELGIPADALLIGCIGRNVPEKGYNVMFEALALVREKLQPDIAARLHFLAAGNGVTAENESFKNLAFTTLQLDTAHLLNKRADIPRLLRSLDIYVLPSISEAFPNSLVEAMATGLACIATNVGECSEVLSNPSLIVPSHDAVQLADRIVTLAEISQYERGKLGETNRMRITNHFGLGKMVISFDSMFVKAATLNRHSDASSK